MKSLSPPGFHTPAWAFPTPWSRVINSNEVWSVDLLLEKIQILLYMADKRENRPEMWKYSYVLNNPLQPKGVRHFISVFF